jgi:soluble lytic murein transglycosylase-like protein
MRSLLKAALPLLCLLPSVLNAFCFEDAGKKYAISPMLLECIARTESNLDPTATNKNKNGSVDIGLMQVNSYWIRILGLDRDRLITDACYNTMAGALILRQCIDRHGYTWEAVGCYNAISMDKKTAYSWKIFRQLKSERRRQKSVDATLGKDLHSSLFFRAWDILDNTFGHESQRPAGGTP